MIRAVFMLLVLGIVTPVTGWARTVDVTLTCNTGGTCSTVQPFTFSYTETDPCMTGALTVASGGFALESSRPGNMGNYSFSSQNVGITAPSCNLTGTLTYTKGTNLTINLGANTFTVGSGANAQSGTVALTIPEPGTLALFMGGLGILLVRGRARRIGARSNRG